MAKPMPRPIFPLKFEFYESLDRFIHEAGMLANTVDAILRLNDTPAYLPKLPGPAVGLLRDRLNAFNAMRHGPGDGPHDPLKLLPKGRNAGAGATLTAPQRR
jgi:hypothetical protein